MRQEHSSSPSLPLYHSLRWQLRTFSHGYHKGRVASSKCLIDFHILLAILFDSGMIALGAALHAEDALRGRTVAASGRGGGRRAVDEAGGESALLAGWRYGLRHLGMRIEVGEVHLGQWQATVGQLQLMAIDVKQRRIQSMWIGSCSRCSGVGGAAILTHQHLHGHTLCGTQQGSLVLLDLLAFGLVASVLEPDLHLCLRQTQCLGHFTALRPGQITLLCKATLQLKDLGVAKGGARTLLATKGTSAQTVLMAEWGTPTSIATSIAGGG